MTGPAPDSGEPAAVLSPVSRARQLRWLGLATVAVVVVAGPLTWVARHDREATAEAPASPPNTFQSTPQQLKTLTVEPVATHAFVSVEVADGRIAVNADRTTPVYSPFSGRIVALIAGPGDEVSAGAPLATVEATEFIQAQNDLAVSLAQLRLTQAAETRKRSLYEVQGASLADVQQAEADRATATAALDAVENRLRILGRSEADIARLRSGGRMEGRVSLPSPIKGVIVDRQAGPGQYLQAGAGTPIFTVADTRTVWVIGNVPEGDASRVKRGQLIEVRVPAWPDRVFGARLEYVAATVDPATHRVTVRGALPNGDGALKPEMLATLRIVTSGLTASPAVPQGAVVYEGEHAHVWVVGNGDVIGLREVRTGRSSNGLVEVLVGLKPGERVVTRGSLFIDRAARHD